MALALSKRILNAFQQYAVARVDAHTKAADIVAWIDEHEQEAIDWPRNPDGTLLGLGYTLQQLAAVRADAEAIVAAGESNPAARTVLLDANRRMR